MKPADPFVERSRRREAESIAHRGVGAAEFDVFGYVAFVPEGDPDAGCACHRGNRFVDRDRGAGSEIERPAERRVGDDPPQRVRRVVDVHEVDEISAVTADDELALSVHDRAQPPRRDLARRLVRTVRAEEADVRVARQQSPPLGEERHIAFRRELRYRVRKQRIDRRRRRDGTAQAVVHGAGRHVDHAVYRDLLEHVDHRDGVELEVPPGAFGRDRGIAVRREVKDGIGTANAASEIAHRIGVDEIARDSRHAREVAIGDERRQIGRSIVDGDDFPVARRTQQHVAPDESRRAGAQQFHSDMTRLLDYSITQLLDYSITRLLHYSITRLLDYSITRLPDYSITRLPDYPITRLPDLTVAAPPCAPDTRESSA